MGELYPASHEHSASPGYLLSFTIAEKGFGQKESSRVSDHPACSRYLSLGDLSYEVDRELYREEQYLFDKRVCSEECCVIEGLEIHRSMNCAAGVKEPLTYGYGKLRIPFR